MKALEKILFILIIAEGIFGLVLAITSTDQKLFNIFLGSLVITGVAFLAVVRKNYK